MTVPFIHLIRHLLNSINERKSKEQSQHNIQARGGGDINNKLNTSSASNNNPTGSSFLLINQTGTTVRYKVISSQSMNTLLKPEILILEKADNEFIELVKDSQTHLPLKISSFAYKNKLSLNATKLRSEEDGREEQGSDVGNGHTEEEEEDFFQTPRLIIQVSGWKPVYPIALNQLGTYYRILERMPGNADFEILKNQCNECWKYDLPIANRLVIDIVPGLMSLGLANLCFSPAKTVMNRQNMTSAVNSISSLGSSSSNKFSDDLYNWAYVYEHHHNDHHQTFDESGGEEEAKLMPSTQHHHHQQQRQSLHPSLSAASMSTATTTAGLSSSTSSSSMLVDFTEDKHRSSIQHGTGDLQEAALISTCKLLPPTTRPFPSSIQQQQQRFPSSTSSTSSSPNKKSLTTFTTNKFHMCVAVVRDDQFPLDPQWSSDQLFYANNNSKHLLPISLPSHHITIGPVVRITNLLPCDIFYYFDKTEVNGSLKSKEDTCVYNVSVGVRF
ncbi:unnamed protein product [Trichobilharzia regenti]|nr:unnamed protein product [Trichobilharzia regenti]